MMDFNERVIPDVSANFLYQEALARYVFAKKIIGDGKNILDLGCGTGYGSHFLSHGNKVLGIDRDREAVAYARRHYGSKVHFKLGDVESFKSIVKFEAICSFEVIEHLLSPKKYLSNVKKNLHTDGVFILSTPNAEIPAPEDAIKSVYHTKEYTLKELEVLLLSVFKNVKLYGQCKDEKASRAFADFMRSQKVRSSYVRRDTLGIRKLFPKSFKEKIWKYVGVLYGRKTQDLLSVDNFPITNRSLKNAEYFIAVCRNS